MLLAAARRFFLLLGIGGGFVVLVSLAFGLLVGSSAERSISVGLYVMGSFLLIAGFFTGNRGPVRLKREEGAVWLPFAGSRMVRWASHEEQEESLNMSAVYVFLGLVLILLGVAADPRYSLF